MLLVWDVHINSRIKDKLLWELRQKILDSWEKNIIFLWDYVYHFSYERDALVELFALFVDLIKAWKKLWIMSGNHDWISEKFVFEEGAMFSQLVQDLGITFVDKPIKQQIEWKNILFLPFNHKIWLDLNVEFVSNIKDQTQKLWQSPHTKKKISGKINEWLAQNIEGVDVVLHHLYIADTKFPGQKSKFRFEDIALGNWIFDSDVKFISGHLHGAFAYKNYFCVGSIWAVSPMEINEFKHIWQRDGQQIKGIPMNIRTSLEQSQLDNFVEEIYKIWTKEVFDSNNWQIDLPDKPKVDSSNIYLFLRDFELKDIPEQVFKEYWEVKLTKSKYDVQSVELQSMDMEKMKVSFGEWKEVLKEYLQKKYPSDWEKYISQLQNLKIL